MAETAHDPTDLPETKYRKDYRPPAWLVDRIALDFDLDPEATVVGARLEVRRNPGAEGAERAAPLILDGEELELIEVRLNDQLLPGARYRLDGERMAIEGVPDHAVVETRVRIGPAANTRLEGLYVSNGIFCTQCEPEGFRRITFFPDRPDVMSRYRVRIAGPSASLPVMLSNGNLIRTEEIGDGRHAALWEDPFPKPSYLFALVAGDLARIPDRFVTRSGRDVLLEIYTEHQHADKCAHAMASLKKAMKWDEDRFGLEYDLDRFMIVAISDFNMGAMENKGLNVFNTKYVLAKPATATDVDYMGIESVVAHEYFHNWTGNRVTCRDWFQLSLKEGLTVFRDEEFTSDLHSRPVKRIEDVRRLRAAQFPEDAGPLAHPIRPESYVEMNNFYTPTVYNKGAEVIRMLHTLIGEDAFQKGMRLYFERHDGEAVTCEDFVAAMEDAAGRDLGQFRLWYSQAGTPRLDVQREHDPARAQLTLTVRQTVPPTPGQSDKRPMPVPLALGLLDRDGRALPLRLAGENTARGTSRVLEVTETEQRFVFEDVAAPAVPSLLRGFSAPVILESGMGDDDLIHLARHDPEPVARWEAMQVLATRLLLRMVEAGGELVEGNDAFVDVLAAIIADPALDPSYRAEILTLPGEGYLGEQMTVIDVDGVHRAREALRAHVGRRLLTSWHDLHRRHGEQRPYRIDGAAIGRRSLRNLALAYLMAAGDADGRRLCVAQFDQADNMTDRLAAFALVVESDLDERAQAIERFYADWRNEPLVLDKWFSLQAMAQRPDALDVVHRLAAHEAFSLRNPNRVRALLGAFASGNPTGFHRRDGAGYRFIAERLIALDAVNPQIASRLAGPFSRWRRYDERRQALMQAELRRIAARPDLSRDVREI
ncbi:MAG TPA: aminopeptidase N, partial [Geminicoccaceae bacterium]